MPRCVSDASKCRDQTPRIGLGRGVVSLDLRAALELVDAVRGVHRRVHVVPHAEDRRDDVDAVAPEGLRIVEELAEAALGASGAFVTDALRDALDRAGDATEGVIRFLDFAWETDTEGRCAGCWICWVGVYRTMRSAILPPMPLRLL